MREDGKIDYIEFPAAGVPAVKSFYAEAFGWGFVDYGPDYAAFEGAAVDGGFNGDAPDAAANAVRQHLTDASDIARALLESAP